LLISCLFSIVVTVGFVIFLTLIFGYTRDVASFSLSYVNSQHFILFHLPTYALDLFQSRAQPVYKYSYSRYGLIIKTISLWHVQHKSYFQRPISKHQPTPKDGKVTVISADHYVRFLKGPSLILEFRRFVL
jgi:hypothetical protein